LEIAFIMFLTLNSLLLLICLAQDDCAHDRFCYEVRVTVGRGAAVLKVSAAVLAHVAGYSDAGAAVGHSGREVVNAGGLVETGQAASVVGTLLGIVHGDVVRMSVGQSLDGIFNVPNKTSQSG